jgi:diguanylate cyclase (GGDEF)-like protein
VNTPAQAGADAAAEHEALIQFLYLAPVGLVQAQADGHITLINPISAQLLMPLSRDGSLDNLFTALQEVAPELRTLCANFADARGMICDGMHIHLHHDAQQRRPDAPHILALSIVKLDAQRLMAVLQDVTVQVQRESLLRRCDELLAGTAPLEPVVYDGLTGLMNRDSFFRLAGHELARTCQYPRPCTMVLFDLDHFKHVNVVYNFLAGDTMLRAIAQALRTTFRAVDLVSRTRGQEFAVLLPATGEQQASAVADRMRATLENELVPWEDTELNCTVSAGVAQWDGVCDIDMLYARAGEARYAAKDAGRNRVVCWNPTMVIRNE